SVTQPLLDKQRAKRMSPGRGFSLLGTAAFNERLNLSGCRSRQLMVFTCAVWNIVSLLFRLRSFSDLQLEAFDRSASMHSMLSNCTPHTEGRLLRGVTTCDARNIVVCLPPIDFNQEARRAIRLA